MSGRDHSYECEKCGMSRGGLNDYECACDVQLSEAFVFAMTETGEELLSSMWTLAGNLRWGAALCMAFRQGYDAIDSFGDNYPDAFWPGHSLPAPHEGER